MAISKVGNNQVVNTLKKSPTGRKLLAEAEKKGVKIQFGANLGKNVNGQYNPNNNTIQVKNGSLETMVETLGHELVHATTKGNGNSKAEEKMAFKIGEQIAGEAGVDNNKHNGSFWDNFVDKAYSGLKNDNGIASALGAMGIGANGGNNTAGNTAANNTNNAAVDAPATANNANVNYNPFQAAAPQATQAAQTPQTNPFANPLNAQQGQQAGGNQQMMQMLMQMMQMIWQMMSKMMGGQNGQNDQQNPINNPLTPVNNPLAANPDTANQKQPQYNFQIMTFQSV